jgi:hypothetical protein
MKCKLLAVISVAASLGVFGSDALAGNLCGNQSIGTIQFQPCDKISVEVGRSLPKINMEEFIGLAIVQTNVVIAQHNIVATELIAKALIEQEQGTFALTVLAYKIPESVYKQLPLGLPTMWLAQK